MADLQAAAHDWAELDAQIKRHHDTGEHGGRHLAMPETLWSAVRASGLPRAEPRPLWAPNLGALAGIPIVVDDDIPHNEWRLRDNGTREVVLSGVTREATS